MGDKNDHLGLYLEFPFSILGVRRPRKSSANLGSLKRTDAVVTDVDKIAWRGARSFVETRQELAESRMIGNYLNNLDAKGTVAADRMRKTKRTSGGYS